MPLCEFGKKLSNARPVLGTPPASTVCLNWIAKRSLKRMLACEAVKQPLPVGAVGGQAMSEVTSEHGLIGATIRRSRRLSAIWLVPVIAVAIGAWLAWDTLSKEGPTITISFETAEGLQAGQSQLKFRDIVLGTVKSLDLSDGPLTCPGDCGDHQAG